MSTMTTNKVDLTNEERNVIDNLIASSQSLMGSQVGQVHYDESQAMTTPASQKSQNALKSRRGRTSFTPTQLSDMEAAFGNTHYPDFQTRKDLSKKLKIPDDRVQVWFQNRRAKWRKSQRQQSTPGHMTPYQNGQITGTTQNINTAPLPDISLVYNMSRPSPIRHTATLEDDAKVSAETTPVTTRVAPDALSVLDATLGVTGVVPAGNMFNVYGKARQENKISENQKTAPSLYSLSAAVTSSGQYIVLGGSGGPPTSYLTPVSNYNPVQIPARGHDKY